MGSCRGIEELGREGELGELGEGKLGEGEMGGGGEEELERYGSWGRGTGEGLVIPVGINVEME